MINSQGEKTMRRKWWLPIVAGVACGMISVQSPAQAFDFCKKRTSSTTYYEPVVTACSPCSAPGPQTLVPVTVTTRKVGLFGLRKRTTVSYGCPVQVAPAAPVIVAPLQPAPNPPAPCNSAYPPG